MIPRIFFTYWEGDQLSKLHYYTIYSLAKLNPDIEIIIYTSLIESPTLIQWNSSEHSIEIQKKIKLDEIVKISHRIILKPIDFSNEYGINGNISCVFKADFVRIAKLYEHGGAWFDFDILFIKKIPDSLFTHSELNNGDKTPDILYFEYHGTIPTGFLLSSPNNTLLLRILEEAKIIIQNVNENNGEYQMIGPNLWNKHFKSDETTFKYCLPRHYLYPYLWYNIPLFFESNDNLIEESTFAIHWYNGGYSDKNFTNTFDENNIDPNKSVADKCLFDIINLVTIVNNNIHSLSLKNNPFPYGKLDNFLNEDFATKLQKEILDVPSDSWDRYDNPFEQKYTLRDKFNFPPLLKDLFQELTSQSFVSNLSELTGYSLMLDDTRNFWGVHTYGPGDKLDIHVDAGLHPTFGLKKQVTLGIYLSYDWKEEYGCNLEIWRGDNCSNNDAKLIERVDSISPLFNRLVLFTCNDYAWHGNPEPASCPETSKRIFITLSYLSENFEDQNKRMKAFFIARPGDPADKEKDKLRLLRADPEKYKEMYRI